MKAITTLCIVCLLLTSTHALAKQRWYSVEILIFENLDPAHLQSETWPTEPGTPDYNNTVNRINIETTGAQAFDSKPYTILGNSNLSAHANSLRRMSNFNPIFQKSWRFPVQKLRQSKTAQYERIYLEVPSDTTDAQRISAFGDSPISAPPKLEGTIEITIGRLLHVTSDWLYRRLVKVPLATSFDSPINNASTPQFTTSTQTLHIKTHRGMRSKKLHYIDHPAVGMLVIFTPYKPGTSADAVEVPNPLADLKKNVAPPEPASIKENDN
ncbi:MAG: hypothetical protein HN790_09340 [Methylococcales bacterium]|jgi:hypothetical protein|nr:hypothetical protein [Methylococcales bacterium]